MRAAFAVITTTFATLSAQQDPQTPSVTSQDARARSTKPKVVFLGDNGNVPLEYLEDGEPTGFNIDVVRAICDAAGIDPEFRLIPWNDSKKRFAAGEGDAFTGVIVSPDRRRDYALTAPTVDWSYSLFIGAPNGAPSRALSSYPRIGFIEQGKAESTLTNRGHRGAQPVSGYSDGFASLQNGSIDAMFTNPWTGRYYLKQNGIADIVCLEPPIVTKPIAIAVRKSNKALRDRLDRGLVEIRANGTFERISDHWNAVQAVLLDPPPAPIVRHWSVDDGLPQGTANSIAQSAEGYLWIATFGGLARFDGVRFENYSIATDPGFRGNRALRVFVDDEQSVWVGMEQSGVLRRKAGEQVFTEVLTTSGPLEASVTDIKQGIDGRIWVGADRVYRYIDGLLSAVPNAPRMPTALLPEADGSLLVGHPSGLSRLTGTSIQPIELPRGRDDGPIATLVQAPDATPIIGLQNGVLFNLRADGVSQLAKLETQWLGALVIDQDGRLLAGTGSGLFRSAQALEATGPLRMSRIGPDDDLRTVFVDREHSVWAGSQTRGITQLRRSPLTHLLRGSSFRALAGDEANDRLWFIRDHQVFGLQANRLLGLSIVAEADSALLEALFVDRDGQLWAGGSGAGLYRRGGDILEPMWNTPTPTPVRSITQSDDGTIWLGCEDGIGTPGVDSYTPVVRTPAAVNVLLTPRSLPGLWVGMTNGVAHFDGERVTELPRPSNKIRILVRCLHEDERGVLWVGTYGAGLLRYEDGVCAQITTRDGLTDNAIQAIIPGDDPREFWLNSDKGPFRVQRDDLDQLATGAIHSIDSDTFAGLEGNNRTAGWRDRSGRIWFATVDGLSLLSPATVTDSDIHPGVTVESVYCDGVEYSGDTIEVPPGDVDLDFTFTGLAFDHPEAIRFSYQLEGYSEATTAPLGQRSASFTRVPPGSYTFIVKARNSSGTWSEPNAVIHLDLRPAFHQTGWFYALCTLTVISLALLAHFARLRGVKRNRRQLERRVAERTDELRSVNEELRSFTYTVSHDLRAPLRHIGFYASRAQADLIADGRQETADVLSGITRSSRRMSRLIDDLLTLAQLGRKVVKPGPVDSNALVASVWKEVSSSDRQGSVEFVSADLPAVTADERLLRHVWQNLIGNAVKYSSTTEGARVEAFSFASGGRTWFRVSDNGVGFDEAYAHKLFAPFERLHSEDEFEGTGIGLAIARRMVEKHGGTIRGHSADDSGAVFEFTLDSDPTT